MAPVKSILNNAKGIKVFQPNPINWSYLKRGMVQRIHMNKNMNNTILISKVPTPIKAAILGATLA